jgi:hypothetical protein
MGSFYNYFILTICFIRYLNFVSNTDGIWFLKTSVPYLSWSKGDPGIAIMFQLNFLTHHKIPDSSSKWTDRLIPQVLYQFLNFAMIVSSALMLWKGLFVLTHCESPIVVVLSGSMQVILYSFGKWTVFIIQLFIFMLKTGSYVLQLFPPVLMPCFDRRHSACIPGHAECFTDALACRAWCAHSH